MRSLRPILVPLAVLVLVTLAALPGRARAASEADELTQLSNAYLARWLERHPAEATVLGAHRYDEGLTPVSDATLDEDRIWTREMKSRVTAIPDPGPKRPEHVQRAVLLAALDRDLVLLEDVRPWRRDPACVLPLVDDAITVLADPRRGTTCHRLPLLAARLAKVPEVLRAARVVLSEPDSAAIAAAIPRFEELARYFRTTLGASVIDCHDGGRQAQFAEADSAAVRAVVDYTRALRNELLPSAGHAPPLPRDAVVRWLAAEGVTGFAPESLLARAERARADSGSLETGAPLELADSSAVLAWLTGAVARAPASFATRGRAFTLPIGQVPLRVGVLRLRPGDPWSASLFGPGPWEPVGRGFRLELWTPLPARLAENQVRDAVDRALVDLARAGACRTLPPLRQALVWEATAEGIRDDFGADRHADEADATARWLHTLLEGAAPGAPYVASRAGLAAPGRWCLQALRDETRAALGRRWNERAFHDAVLAAGDAPWPLVRESVLARFGR
jgi:hypothetical protein